MTSVCAEGVPWLNLNLAMSMPSSTIRSSISGDLHEGPMVTATLVLRVGACSCVSMSRLMTVDLEGAEERDQEGKVRRG